MKLEVAHTEAQRSEALVNRILSGDRSAETEMVINYQAKLFNAIQRHSWDTDLTNDIVQETWAIALEKIRGSKLVNKQSLGGFISKVGINQLTMHYRKINKVSYDHSQEIHELSSEASLTNGLQDHNELIKTIQNLLTRMKIDRDRDLITGFYLHGKSKQELCKQYQLNSEHFDRVLYRARSRFKKEWDCGAF